MHPVGTIDSMFIAVTGGDAIRDAGLIYSDEPKVVISEKRVWNMSEFWFWRLRTSCVCLLAMGMLGILPGCSVSFRFASSSSTPQQPLPYTEPATNPSTDLSEQVELGFIPGKVVVTPFTPLLKDAEDQGEGVLMQWDVVAALASQGWNATAGNKFEKSQEMDLTASVANYGCQQSAQYVLLCNYSRLSENETRLIGMIVEVKSQKTVGGIIATSEKLNNSSQSIKQVMDDFDKQAVEQMEKLRPANPPVEPTSK